MSMERLSDNAIQIINDLHTERLDYNTEYLSLIDAANQLAAYEDTGLTPERVKAQQWISVKDRLPDNEEDDVLIYCREIEHYGLHKEKRKAYHAIYKGAYDGDRWYTNWCYGCKYIEDANAEYPDEEIIVTHWMPLPEPPKEAQHDN